MQERFARPACAAANRSLPQSITIQPLTSRWELRRYPAGRHLPGLIGRRPSHRQLISTLSDADRALIGPSERMFVERGGKRCRAYEKGGQGWWPGEEAEEALHTSGGLKAGSTDLRASPQKPPSNLLASLMLADPTFRDSPGLPGCRRVPARVDPRARQTQKASDIK